MTGIPNNSKGIIDRLNNGWVVNFRLSEGGKYLVAVGHIHGYTYHMEKSEVEELIEELQALVKTMDCYYKKYHDDDPDFYTSPEGY